MFKTTQPFSSALPEANLHELANQSYAQHLDLYPIEKKYTAKQIALIDNEIELDALVVDMKICKGKWKTMAKRLEKLKKLSDAHSFNPNIDSE